jgi:DNA polymerase|tara:strand:+ start:3663 stop:4850 length:1188 start_codon:yes stop_codon:yes gene_type:complete
MKTIFKDVEESDGCLKCKLHKGCKTPYMKETGEGRKDILVVAEAPGKTEDQKGVQLVGEAGQVLRDVLNMYGIDLDKDCWKTNAVACRPPKNRTPSKREIKCCNPRVLKVIKEKKPKLILLLGGVALDSFLTVRFKGASGGINKWRGFIIPDQTSESWVAPTFHPSFILRSKGVKTIKKLFQQDIRTALRKVKVPLPKYDYNIDILNEFRANNMLQEFFEKQLQEHLEYPPDLLAFDYETTGLQPYKEGHEIVCCSVCWKDEVAYSFMLTNKLIRRWKHVLRERRIKKTAQNIKFEHQWSRNILGVQVRGWVWDTMQASHIIDNRSGITGLKFQSYVNFGQGDYASHLDKYLKCDDGNGFNKIHEAPEKELLKYCGMDSMLQFRLAKLQMEEVYL